MKSYRILSLVLAVALVFAFFSGAALAGEGGKLKVVCLLNGNLGDKSFFDSAAKGVAMINELLADKVEANYVEMGFDSSVWSSTLQDVSDADYDVIVVGTYQLQDLLQEIAPQHQDKHYIIFDSSVDYSNGDCDNVYSITFKQNEASYLAGAVAALVAQEQGKDTISAVGGMEIPVINDFIVGYIQGATDAAPDTKVIVSYVGNFNDTATAKELAGIQFQAGSVIGFNVAAQAGLGLIQAASEQSALAIGVDADQAAAFAADNNAKLADCVVTSVLKNIDQAIFQSVERHLAGELPYGATESLGMLQNAVGIADNEYYQGLTTEAIRATASDLAEKVNAGEITVKSAFDETFDAKAYIDAAQPK